MSQGFTSQLPVPLPVAQGGTGVTTDNWTAGSLAFSPTTQGIVGTTAGNNAGAGYVGEYISSTILVASAVTVTANVIRDVTSITLTAGDYDVWGNVNVNSTAQTQTYSFAWTDTVSATLPADTYIAGLQQSSAITINNYRTVLQRRYSLSSTTTIYLSIQADGGGTLKAWGGIYARRVR